MMGMHSKCGTGKQDLARRVVFHRALAVVGFVTLLAGSGRVAGEEPPADSLARFKAFIANPPVVQRMVFESVSLGGKSPEFFVARWQTNGFFLQCFRTLSDLEAG